MSNPKDSHGQPDAAFRARENILKTVEHLIGLCRGLVCDGELHDCEIVYLDTWIRNNASTLREHPIGRLLIQRVERVLADGAVSDEERVELLEVLGSVIGGAQEDNAAGGLSMSAPNKIITERIEFANRSFVITGKFLYGPRRIVEQAITERFGLIHDGVTQKSHYVVVGTMGSRDWTNTSFGSKLEKVHKLREEGFPIVILSEPEWADALGASNE